MNSSIAAMRLPCADAVVLCIDDDNVVLDVMQSILERHGYAVLTATSGEQGIEIFRDNSVDLVLVDYEMPGLKGDQVALHIRDINPHVPILLHSGHARIPEIALELTDGFMPKGVEPYVLVAEIAQLIMQSRSTLDAVNVRLPQRKAMT